jgi:hypothetical protein
LPALARAQLRDGGTARVVGLEEDALADPWRSPDRPPP